MTPHKPFQRVLDWFKSSLASERAGQDNRRSRCRRRQACRKARQLRLLHAAAISRKVRICQ